MLFSAVASILYLQMVSDFTLNLSIPLCTQSLHWVTTTNIPFLPSFHCKMPFFVNLEQNIKGFFAIFLENTPYFHVHTIVFKNDGLRQVQFWRGCVESTPLRPDDSVAFWNAWTRKANIFPGKRTMLCMVLKTKSS